MSGPRALDVAVPHGPRLRLLTWGAAAAPPLLLVHGGAAHAGWWTGVAPILATRFRLLVPDLRGHGASDHADSYLIEDFAADCVAVLDQLAPGAAGLVGHSMGGRVAAWIAAHHPARARALALLDTRLGAVPRARADAWRGTRPADAPRRRYASRAAAERTFRLTPPEPGVPADVLAALAADAVVEQPDGAWTLAVDRRVLAVYGSRAADLLPLLAGVRCPALLLRGRHSDVIGERQAAALQVAMPHAVQELMDGGHHFLLAHPATVANRLLEFFG